MMYLMGLHSALDDFEEEIDQLVIIAEIFGCSPDDIRRH